MFKLYDIVGIFGTVFSIILFHAAFGLPFAIFLLRNFFVGIPKDIMESARIDGASEFRIFVRLILHGGSGSFLGKPFTVLGLDRTEQLLRSLPQSQRVQTIRTFIHTARAGLARTGTALEATAHPIQLRQPKAKGRSWLLSAQVQSYGIALTVTFLALLLAAGAAAAERDEGTIGRLRRGLVTLGQLVWSKVALKAIDYKTGQIRWSHEYAGRGGANSGILTTAGKLLFTGDPNGNFIAYDPATGRTLWHSRLTASVSNGPMTYELDGKQYLVVGAGDSLYAFTVLR